MSADVACSWKEPLLSVTGVLEGRAPRGPRGTQWGPQEDAAVLCDPGHTSLPCLGECPWSHRAPAVFEPPARAADSARLGFLPLGELADEKKL